MGDSEKPFACPSPGCNMSFTNEDHLVVHKKKHDMVLNLGNNGKNTFVADQTPTPTRFIRNCEEVGLFQDLQNVNPFEETFRRAVEDGKTVALSESEATSTDDTLHTPHIFPNIVESSVEIEVQKSSEDSSLEENKNQLKGAEIIVETKKSTEDNCNLLVAQQTQTLVAPKIENSRTTTNLSINGQEVQLLLKTADGKLMQLSAMPVSEERQESYHQVEGGIETRNVLKTQDSFDGSKKHSGNCSNNRLNLVKMKLKQSLTKNSAAIPKNSSQEKSEDSKSNEDGGAALDQRRKQDVLARNRASSMRARAKRKAWVQQLQKVATTANERNAVLQHEVKALKSEVAKLRALLLTHANCPVTKAMEKGTTVDMEKNITTVQSIVPNVEAQSNVLSRRKKTNRGETPIAPKIPRLSIIHPPILPKVDSAKQSLVIEDLSTVKIVDVKTINNEPRKIVFLENPKRLELVRTTRQLIRVNPSSLQVENAASKCTGT